MSASRLAVILPFSLASAVAILLGVYSLTASARAGASANAVTAPAPRSAASSAVAYLPPDMSSISPAELKHYYRWREKMDWLLVPIHTRANLKVYLKKTAKTGSPLDALPPEARKRFLSMLEFGPYGAFAPYYGDLQYLSTQQVYKILALFGEQSRAIEFTGGRIQRNLAGTQPNAGQPSPVQQDFQQYWKALQPPLSKPRGPVAARSYARLFASKQNPNFIRKATNGDLRLLFRAAYLAATYTFEARYARDARMDFAEMQRRHFAGPPDYGLMYGALLDTRQFAAMHKFYKTYPDKGLTPFPAYRDEAEHAGKDAPTVLAVNATKHELIRRPADLGKPAQVVILTDPDCGPCRQFDRALQSRPKLRAVVEKNTLWVTPPGSELEFDTLQQWNKAHPRMQLGIMYSLQGWPIKILAMPQFFFMQNGKVVAHDMSWGENGDFSKLESGLKSIGLWP